MTTHREHAHLDTPLEAAWDLIGDPAGYPKWWPRIVEVEGDRFEQGDEYVQVTRDPFGSTESRFLIEARDDLREIRMSCQLTGSYAHWWLTSAQGGTFVELEMGMDPRRLGDRVFDATVGKRYFRRWSEQSLAALREAVAEAVGPVQPSSP